MRKVPIRRTDTENVQVGGFDDGIRRYYDQNMEMTIVKLMTGDCYVTAEPREMLVTILGSCISVCARDSIAKCGGMNHILLPGDTKSALAHKDTAYANRFGAFAMEELLNGLYKLGAKKERIEVKVFGGGNVIKSSALIGTKNIEFVHQYLKAEGLKIVAQDVGGNHPRRIHYFPDSGKLMMRILKRKDDFKIIDEESRYTQKIIKQKDGADVELF